MAETIIVADYTHAPSEGINVISKTIIDDLRNGGYDLDVMPPSEMLKSIPRLLLKQPRRIIFTHGPGVRTVFTSWILRLFSRAKIIWLATRPDVATPPEWLKGRKTAHIVIGNRTRPELSAVAPDASFVRQFIGIAPERLQVSQNAPSMWPELRQRQVPIAVHVGHLRRSRGLDLLIEAKKMIGDRGEIVVQGSPNFPPDPGITEELRSGGVHVMNGHISEISRIYRSADLYLFPVKPEDRGAIDLPLSVLEATACGCPVISTDFGAIPEAFDGVAGVTIVNSADFAKTVSEAILRMPLERPTGLPEHLDVHRITDILRDLMR